MKIAEIITSHDQDQLSSAGWKVRDELELKTYTLSLIDTPDEERACGPVDCPDVQIALARNGMNFLGTAPKNKIPLEIPTSFNDLRPILIKINHWIKQYGTLLVGAPEPRKLRIYEKILKKAGFKVRKVPTPWADAEYNLFVSA